MVYNFKELAQTKFLNNFNHSPHTSQPTGGSSRTLFTKATANANERRSPRGHQINHTQREQKFRYFYHTDHLEGRTFRKCLGDIFSEGPACRGGSYITGASWGFMAYCCGNVYYSTIEPDRIAIWGEESGVEYYFGLMKTKFVDNGIPVILATGILRLVHFTKYCTFFYQRAYLPSAIFLCCLDVL